MEKKLTALIVDDEEKAIKLLHQLLRDTGQFSTIRSARSGISAMDELAAWSPDLVFLDIRMPDVDGLRLLKQIRGNLIRSEIVFVTAYDKYALDAIRNYAFGYLMKPVNRTELDECIANYKQRKGEPDIVGRLSELLKKYESDSRLRFNTRNGYFLLDPAEILYCEADGNYTRISTGDKVHLCSVQLGKVEEMLSSNGLVRAGRSLLINFKHVASVDRKKNELHFEKNGLVHAISVTKSQLREIEKHPG